MNKLLASLAALAALSLPSLARAQMVNAQTGATYTMANTDCDPSARKLITFNNAAGVTVTIPQAGASGNFLGGCVMNVENVGTGVVTITPTTSTINGVASLTLNQGAGAAIFNDSSPSATGNYWSNLGTAGASGTPFANFRNLLDNGNMALSQRSEASAIACGGTTGTTSNTGYGPDRWACITNVGSQQGRIQTVTSSPTPPTGFKQSVTIWRNSASLTQPVCLIQEVPYADSLTLAGQQATFSAQIQALGSTGSLAANAVTMYILTGTGASGDQGLATMTASPAVTPAWTGIASSINKSVTATAAWQRFSVSGAIPAAATEIAVQICYTPSGTSGATDGIAVVGAQLEQGFIPTPYEFKPVVVEQVKAQYYFWQITDPAATVEIPSSCFVTAANTTVKCGVYLPVPMRVAPTTVVSTATSFGIVVTAGTAGTCTTLAATASSNSTQSIGVTCTTGGTIALGSATPLIGAATAGTLAAYADF